MFWRGFLQWMGHPVAAMGIVHTRTGIGIQHRNTLLSCSMLKEALLRTVVTGTCQSSKVYQQRTSVQRIFCRLWGQVEVEGHFAIGRCSFVRAFQELAAEAGDGRFRSHCHCFFLGFTGERGGSSENGCGSG